MNKLGLKEQAILKLFLKRRKQARKEYLASVAGTPYEFMMVSYRNNLLNPLDLKPNQIKDLYEVPPESIHAQALDRLIRVYDDMAKTDSYLTYILNFSDSTREFNHIVFGTEEVTPARELQIKVFKQTEEDKIKFLKRMRLLADVT